MMCIKREHNQIQPYILCFHSQSSAIYDIYKWLHVNRTSNISLLFIKGHSIDGINICFHKYRVTATFFRQKYYYRQKVINADESMTNISVKSFLILLNLLSRQIFQQRD